MPQATRKAERPASTHNTVVSQPFALHLVNIYTKTLATGLYINVTTILDLARQACKQLQVNEGDAFFLGKKHSNVYISHPISVSRCYIQGFMIHVEYEKKFCLQLLKISIVWIKSLLKREVCINVRLT